MKNITIDKHKLIFNDNYNEQYSVSVSSEPCGFFYIDKEKFTVELYEIPICIERSLGTYISLDECKTICTKYYNYFLCKEEMYREASKEYKEKLDRQEKELKILFGFDPTKYV